MIVQRGFAANRLAKAYKTVSNILRVRNSIQPVAIVDDLREPGPGDLDYRHKFAHIVDMNIMTFNPTGIVQLMLHADKSVISEANYRARITDVWISTPAGISVRPRIWYGNRTRFFDAVGSTSWNALADSLYGPVSRDSRREGAPQITGRWADSVAAGLESSARGLIFAGVVPANSTLSLRGIDQTMMLDDMFVVQFPQNSGDEAAVTIWGEEWIEPN